MSYEIEIKLPVNRADTIEKKLTDLGFVKKSHWSEVDTYFNSKSHNMRESDQALRIRRSTNLDSAQKTTQINFKCPKLDKISMSREELETEVADGEVMTNILIQLSYVPVATVEKQRKYYANGDMTACVDQVKHLGDFLELEILSRQEENRQQCLQQMDDVLQKLGYDMSQTVQQSYLSMLEKGKG